ncbi:MAG: hypothetical protein D6820_16335, partial [Lentisphaerae bacterium]
PGIPNPSRVWTAKVNFLPRTLWIRHQDGKIQRIPLARTPNWQVSDPDDVMSEWWTWEQPQWWKRERHKVTINGKKMHLATDRKHIRGAEDYFRDAIVWTEWGIVMGTPFPTRVERVDMAKGAVAFQGRWWGDSGVIITGNRYFLEDKPQYLDDPRGEFWVEKVRNGAVIHLIPPQGLDPNRLVIEAGCRYNLIEDQASAHAPPRLDVLRPEQREKLDRRGVSHLEIAGLAFQMTNIWWNLEFPHWMHKEVDNAAIRLLGNSDQISVHNCRFSYLAKAVRMDPLTDRVSLGRISVSDNEITHTDHGAITIGYHRHGTRPVVPGLIRRASVLRNRLYMIGLRPYRQSDGHALCVSFPEEMEIAGNFLNRCYGAGIFLFGGKADGSPGEVPLARYLVHHNRVEEALLATNDWGQIEAWQGGPFYIFNNVSRNPGGYWNWASGKPFSARLGYAYYLDGGFKNYLFNNIAWGKNNDPMSRLCNNAAFQEAIPTILNTFFNNTVYRFAKGANWSPRGGFHAYLGNLWCDISDQVFNIGKLKEDKNAFAKPYPYGRMAFSRNIFWKTAKLGHFENLLPSPKEGMYTTVEEFSAALRKRAAQAADAGLSSEQCPLRDPAKGDLRPLPSSVAIDRGARVFVPWSLAR